MNKEIDINNEEEILKECDFDYFYDSEECSRELCMFYNDIFRQKTNENYNYREAIIDLGRIAITLNNQYKRIAELEEQNKVKDLALIDLSNALVEENLPYEEIEEFKGEAGIESVGVDCEDVYYYFIWKAENELQEGVETKLQGE